eukprot:CAMPEP_0184515650 /NCGR_PEP_ID=MMETSP0198_2-20121128/4608_1 /TAXON_ID=1112570 /ORGANISM="Thraustochytrium sp., Strain LLF1b" /LENGTH=207 /DNA_ID=CAMNT_0026905917 /DNA_START=363 /DNA_END=986 /DNA_ORIENTATION=-
MGSCLGKSKSKGTLANAGDGSPGSGRGLTAVKSEKSLLQKLGVPEDSESRQRGCYLVFDSANGGTFIAQWSETAVEGAWAFFFPRTNVAAFKFKQNSGKNELIRGLAVNKNKQFNGWGQFIKLAHDMDGVVQIYDRKEGQADFWYTNDKQEVFKLPHGEWFEARQVSVVAIIPRHNEMFRGVQIIPEEQFVDTAKRAMGYTWKPLRK